MESLRVAIITSSDSCARGERTDRSGPDLVDLVRARGWDVVGYRVCPDDVDELADAIREMADDESADVVLTTGGTGFSPRDVTPEATIEACDRMAPGIAEYIRLESMEITERAMLSRGVSGLRGRTLIVNLPGSPKAAKESFGFVADQFEHAVEMMAGEGHD